MGAMALLLVATACSERTPPIASAPVTTAATGTETAAGDPAAGEQLFSGTCLACHGPGGEGVEGLGKPLPPSEFVAGLSDDELVAFLQVGRPIDDPLNTTGIMMPPRGGNPSLTDADLRDLVAYIRSLQA